MAEINPPQRSCLQITTEIMRIFLAVILAILCVIILSAALVGRASFDILRNAGSYTALVSHTQLTTRLRSVLVNTLISNVIKDNPQLEMVNLQNVSPQSWDNMAAVLLPTDWLDSNFNRLVQTGLTWLNGDNGAVSALSLSLDLTPLKKNLLSSKGALAVQPLLKNLPTCTGSEILQFAQGSLVWCLPADQGLSLIAAQVAAAIADQLPDQIPLQSETFFTPDVQKSLEKAHTAFKTIDHSLTFGLRLALLLLGIYALLQSVSLRRLLRNLGWPLYASGLVLLLLVELLFISTQWGANLWVPSLGQFDSQQSGLRELLVDIIQTMGVLLQGRLFVYSFGLLAVALVAQILAFALGRLEANRL